MNPRLNSDGIVGPFYQTTNETIAQSGEGPVGYFHFRALNDKGISYLLDEMTQAYLQDAFSLVQRDIAKGANDEMVKGGLALRVLEGLPRLKRKIRDQQDGILFDFKFTDLELLPEAKAPAPLAERFRYEGWHSHQGGMGPAREAHSHETMVNFEFVDAKGRPVDISIDEEAVGFIDAQMRTFFAPRYLNTSGEEIVQKLFETGETFATDPQAPESLRNIRLAAAEMTLHYKGDLDHPNVPMTFRVSPVEAPGLAQA